MLARFMKNTLAFLVVCVAGVSAEAQEPWQSRGSVEPLFQMWNRPTLLPIRWEEPVNDGKNGNGKNGNGDNGPEHTRDNGQFVEEASNQEAGVVQHIFNLVPQWERNNGERSRILAFLYTMELPVGSQKHQFSFTLPFLTIHERKPGEPTTQDGGVSDLFLNYRYQLLADDDFLWVAPRFTVILPTGDERFGTGSGRVGYQFGLPISKYGDHFDFHFNAGATFIPDVVGPISTGGFSQAHDLRGYNLGASAYWKLSYKLHLFVEAIAVWQNFVDDDGNRDDARIILVNPGFRYVLAQLENVEWVVGVGVPVGLSRDAPDIGVFGYMSVEHSFLRK